MKFKDDYLKSRSEMTYNLLKKMYLSNAILENFSTNILTDLKEDNFIR